MAASPRELSLWAAGLCLWSSLDNTVGLVLLGSIDQGASEAGCTFPSPSDMGEECPSRGVVVTKGRELSVSVHRVCTRSWCVEFSWKG